MKVDLEVKQLLKVDVEPIELFKALCISLNMDFIFDESEYFIANNKLGEKIVCKSENGKVNVIDDRGDLFIALRNIAVNIIPNLNFR